MVETFIYKSREDKEPKEKTEKTEISADCEKVTYDHNSSKVKDHGDKPTPSEDAKISKEPSNETEPEPFKDT